MTIKVVTVKVLATVQIVLDEKEDYGFKNYDEAIKSIHFDSNLYRGVDNTKIEDAGIIAEREFPSIEDWWNAEENSNADVPETEDDE